MVKDEKVNSISFDRRDLKRRANNTLKKHYLLLVVMCLVAVFLRAEFNSSDYLLGLRTETINQVLTGELDSEIDKIVNDSGNETASIAITEMRKTGDALNNSDSVGDFVEKTIEEYNYKDEKSKEIFGRSAGVLNSVIDSLTADTIPSMAFSVVYKLVGSENVANVVSILVATVISLAFWMFVRRAYLATMRRISLEARIYDKVPLSRYVFLLRVKRWIKTCLTMSLLYLIEMLAAFTIVGGVIVYYMYLMTPYIVAENPDISPIRALRLSRRIMRGNKLHVFKTDVTLLGWILLGFVTSGLSNIFFFNPYHMNIYSEFYVEIRSKAKENEIEDSDLLCDDYLFVKANGSELRKTYSDVIEVLESDTYELKDWTGWRKKLADLFGIVLWITPDEAEYEESQGDYVKMLAHKNEADGISYPSRLYHIPETRKRRSLDSIHYMRHYSVLSIIMMFFLFSFSGWAWEVVFYLAQTGKIINRGVLHGPWLPIYGTGGLLILIFLHWARKRPVVHFFATVVLCGLVEYFTSYFLEVLYDKKWWDYTGYFLNINGRICAEGLFVFGVAGLMFIYVIAPLIDDRIRKIKKSVLVPIAVVLVILFAGDLVWSKIQPNTGDGITDNFVDGAVKVEQPIGE